VDEGVDGVGGDMAQYSDEILNLFGGPELSSLQNCGAKPLPQRKDYFSIAVWIRYFLSSIPDPPIFHLNLGILKRTDEAADAYSIGRDQLLAFVGNLPNRHNLSSYTKAVTQFDHCIGALWEAAELLMKVNQTKEPTYKVFETNGSVWQRIHEINNTCKHFTPVQAATSSAPLWITNTGLRSHQTTVTFDEILDCLDELNKILDDFWIEMPAEAAAKVKSKTNSAHPRSLQREEP
jgi:hypothetical protein